MQDAPHIDQGTDVFVTMDVLADMSQSDVPSAMNDAEEDGGEDSGEEGCPTDSLCLDFEAEGLDGLRFERRQGGTVERVSGPVVNENHVLRVQVPAEGGARALLSLDVPPSASRHLFGRARLFFDAPVNHGHTYLLRGAGPDVDGETLAYRLDGVGYGSPGTTSFNGRYESALSFDTRHGGVRTRSAATPLDHWICVEWEYDAENELFAYWLDGERATDISSEGIVDDLPWRAPLFFETLELGLRQYDPNDGTGTTLFIDDVVLASNRVGC